MSSPAGTKAIILAGGLGTRLQPLVSDRPKPMAQAAGKPFLEYLIEQLRGQGFDELVLCVGHLAGHVCDYFGDGSRWGVRLRYAVERQLLGTAGALRNAASFIDGTFLALNGDSYLDADFRAMVQLHQQRRSLDPQTVGTIAAVKVDDAAAYGMLEMDGRGRILRFREKATPGRDWMNGGAYVLEPEVLDCIPADRPVSIEQEVFPLLLDRGYHLYSHQVEGFFADIGTPEGYRRFQRYIEETGNR
jgi:NDP-sugar pyrophosphorylase family protein